MGDALVPHHHGDLRHDARRQGEFPALFVEGVRQRRAAELAHLFVKVRLREAFGGASSYELERQRRARHPPRICVRRHDGFESGGARPARGHVAAAPRLVGAAGQTERARALAAEDLGHFRQCHARFVGAAVDHDALRAAEARSRSSRLRAALPELRLQLVCHAAARTYLGARLVAAITTDMKRS